MKTGGATVNYAENKRGAALGGKRAILVFQLLLFSSLLLSIVAGIYLGPLPALLAATLLCASAFLFHRKFLGFDGRALFACILFFLLALFFVSGRSLAAQFSFAIIPVAAVAFSALLLVFRLFIYNKRGEGVVLGRHGRLLLVEVLPSPWHSLSGIQVFESTLPSREGEKVGVCFSTGLFSPPRISSVKGV